MDEHSDNACCICAEGDARTTRNALCENKEHLYCQRCATRQLTEKGYCAFCMQSSPRMRAVLFKARMVLWLAYLGDVTVLALDRLVWTMFVPCLEVCFRATVLNSMFGSDMDDVVQLLLIPTIICSDYYLRRFYIESPPGSTFTNQFLRAASIAGRHFLLMGGLVAQLLLVHVKLFGVIIQSWLKLCIKFMLTVVKLCVVVMLVFPVGAFEIWRILGTAAPAIRVLGLTAIVKQYIDSVILSVLIAIVADMFTDPRFQDKFLPFPRVADAPLTRRLTDGFFDGLYRDNLTTTPLRGDQQEEEARPVTAIRTSVEERGQVKLEQE